MVKFANKFYNNIKDKKMKKENLNFKLLLFASFIGIAAFFLFLKINFPNYNNNTDYQNAGNYKQNNQQIINLQMFARTEKTTYRSHENILLNIRLSSDQDLDDIIITAQGIKDRFNKSYFNKSQTISLGKFIEKEINFNETLPSCNACSGLSLGDYTIEVSASFQGKILAKKEIAIRIMQ